MIQFLFKMLNEMTGIEYLGTLKQIPGVACEKQLELYSKYSKLSKSTFTFQF